MGLKETTILDPKLVKVCKDQLVEPLTLLYNRSMESAVYRSYFKLAKVIALYRKKSRSLSSNYRPISLLNCFDQTFERLTHDKMSAFIDS